MYQICNGVIGDIGTGKTISFDDPTYVAWLLEGNLPEEISDKTLPRSFVPGDLLRELRSIGKDETVLALLELPENKVPKALFFSYPELREDDPEFQAFITGLVSAGVLTVSEVNRILKK